MTTTTTNNKIDIDIESNVEAVTKMKANKQQNHCLNVFLLVLLILLVVFIIGCMLIFPLMQLYYGVTYYNQLEHCSDLPEPDVFLIVEGVVMFSEIITLIVTSYASNVLLSENPPHMVEFWNFSCVLSYCLLILCCMFNIAWIIIGSVMFWRDCYHIQPKEINTMMWITLISGYVSYVVIHNQTNKKK